MNAVLVRMLLWEYTYHLLLLQLAACENLYGILDPYKMHNGDTLVKFLKEIAFRGYKKQDAESLYSFEQGQLPG